MGGAGKGAETALKPERRGPWEGLSLFPTVAYTYTLFSRPPRADLWDSCEEPLFQSLP